ncbi:glycosyltransferase family 4 protein [Solirubrobacter ginsenosidimutans]|uniref:Glycosyltransferase family 4 protein n=1 Tax=Solirubrobacter ginsenosidimutans TaxID=490573 RepID=A0A9X3MYU4_9ACTN|nr:glycosyltransferase family 4 protein [Solirubrobacter ginsenosidimutans]MDA0163863.1 glycosyltransferase family 4 protein [Solirubrobacter ginsenosidimutans]
MNDRPLLLGKGWFPDQLGGLDRYYRDLLEHLPEARGIVVGGTAAQPERVGRGAGGALGSAPPARVVIASGHDRPLPHRLVAYWLAAARAGRGVDVVDAHFALYALAPLYLGPLRRKRVVLHFHGPWADESVAAGERSRVKVAAKRALERAVYRRADHAVVLTSAFKRVLVERYGVKPWIVAVEPPGVDLERFSLGSPAAARERFGLGNEAFVAVAVRRLVPRMGLEVLLDAWEDARPSLPPGSTLLIAGDGPLRGALEERAGTGVQILGRIGEDELTDLYRAADVGVVPTLAHEGFGLVVIEAAACGTPSIVTAVGGLPEAVAGLDETLIVEPGNTAALADRLISAQHDRPTPRTTREYAERFAWPRVAERHRAIMRGGVGDERMKVVYVDHVARLSGGEIALLRLLPHLDRVNPHVILAEEGPLIDALHREGISTEVLPLDDAARSLRKARVQAGGVSPRAAAATAAYTLRLARRLRQLRPDLVHTNSLKAGVYGSVAARIAGVPVVWHVRDRIADDYLPTHAVRLVRRMSRHLATAIVANSRSTMATLEAGSGPTVIYSVVPEVMHRIGTPTRIDRRPMTYGIVGRLAPWKGQHLFLDAFARAFPESGERAVVVGGALFGEDDYARELNRLAGSFGIADRVEFRGFRPDVWGELERLDVLVHASVTPEPFGQVILEGMAAAVPVIAARAGGPAEILADDLTGLLVEPNDVGELAAAMVRMQDPQLRARLAIAARQEVRRYEPDVVADQLQALYTKVTAQHRRAESPR